MPMMTRSLSPCLTVFIVFVILVGCGTVLAADRAYEQDLITRAEAMSDPTLRPTMPDGTPLPIKCGTPFIQEVRAAWPGLSPEARLALGDFAVAERPSLENEEIYDVSTPEGTIRIHYTRSGTHAIDTSLGFGAGRVPIYILKCAEFVEETVAKLVTELGYRFPISDRLGNPSEDPEYDIFFVQLGAGLYGQTWSEIAVASSDPGVTLATSWVELNRDYRQVHPYQQRPLDAMAVTVAHEFHHAIQWSYDAFEHETRSADGTQYPWFHELTSTYLEDVVFDDVNDYYILVRWFFRYPWYSLRLMTSAPAESIHPYASAVWGHFLDQKYGHGLMVDVWEECGKQPGFNTFSAFETALSARGSSFAAEWAEFLVWNYFTGPRAASWSYAEGARFGEAWQDFDGAIPDSVVAFFDTYPVADSAHTVDLATAPRRPDELGAAYMLFIPGISQTVDTFSLLLSPAEEFNNWVVVTAGIRGELKPDISFTTNTFDPITVPNWNIYDELLVIVSPFDPAIKEAEFQRNVGFTFEVQDSIVTVAQSSAIAKIYSNPLSLGTVGADEPFRAKIALAEPVEVAMFIYTTDGTLVRGGQGDSGDGNEMYFSAGTRNPTLVWTGKNRDGRDVASGVYLALIQMGGKREIVKIAVKNK